jgi:hypothetical protein
MYNPRIIEGQSNWLDETGVKIYTVSTANIPVEQSKYFPRLKVVKSNRDIDWLNTPAFVIFHDGATCDYLVLVWWQNDNELFTSVSVNVDGQWIEDPTKYSFCLYDLEIMWTERNMYINTIDCDLPSLHEYQVSR